MLSTVAWKMGRAGRRLWRARQRTGVRGLTVEAGKLARDIAKMGPPLAAGYVFDMRRGIRTRGFVRNEEQLAGVSIGGDPHYYEPIGLTPLRRAVELLPLEPAATTFVDLGAGRGRAVIVAAEMGFGRVRGVELDDDLVVQAGENIRRWRARTRVVTPVRQQVTVVQGDRTLSEFPRFRDRFKMSSARLLRLPTGPAEAVVGDRGTGARRVVGAGRAAATGAEATPLPLSGSSADR